MRGVVTITGIEWDGWDGPEERTLILTEGTELPDAELIPEVKGMLEDRYGHPVKQMTVQRQSANNVVASKWRMSLDLQEAVIAANLAELLTLADDTPPDEFAAALDRIQLRTNAVRAARGEL